VPQSPTDPLEILVWKALESGPLLADELVRITGLSVGQLAMVNLGLEMRGVIRRLPGNRYSIPD
jgi:predicted Rossmann fold nucleotide-binding protein DprA/Smf involved in DNA uptake